MVIAGIIGTILGILVVVGSIVAVFHISLPRRVRALTEEITHLRERIKLLEERLPDSDRPTEPEAPATSVSADQSHGDPAPAKRSAANTKARTPLGAFLSRMEMRFAGYWTGVLGVIAIVVGFSFLAILTALRLNEFSRFLLVLTGGGVFWALAELLQRRGNAGLIIGWFRSAAGALVLFGCVGSLTVPWLRWVASMPQAYAVLAVGIAVNAFFALSGVHQLFTTFHVVISVAALAVAPAAFPTLVAATIVTVVGIVPSLRRPWTFHIVVSETAFFAFVIAWILRFDGAASGIAGSVVDLGAALAVVAGIVPVIVTPYVSPTRSTYPGYTTARIAGWVYVILAIVALGRSVQAISAVLAIAGAATYLPVKIARNVPTNTKRTDLVAAAVLVALATLGLGRYNVDVALLAATAVGIMLVAVIDARGDYRFSVALLSVACVGAVALTVGIISAAYGSLPWAVAPGVAATSTAVLSILFVIVYTRVLQDTPIVRAVGALGFFVVLIGHVIVFGLVPRVPSTISIPASSGLILALVPLVGERRRRRPSISSPAKRPQLVSAAWGALLVFIHLRAIVLIDGALPVSRGVRLGVAFTLLLWSALVVLRSLNTGDIVRGLAWIVGTVDIVVVIAILGEDLEPWIVIMLFAALSLAFMGLSRVERRWMASRGTTQSGATTERFAGTFPIQRLIPFSGLAVYLFAAVVTLALAAEGDLSGQFVPRLVTYAIITACGFVWTIRSERGRALPRILPLIVLLIVATGVGIVEAGSNYTATVILSTATIAVAVATVFPSWFAPLRPLSMLLFWTALVGLPFGGTFDATARIAIFTGPWWRTIGTALIGTLYLGITGLKRDSSSRTAAARIATGPDTTDESPRATRWALSIVTAMDRRVTERSLRLLIIPFLLSVTAFFALTARGPVLTTLLVVESFALFALGLFSAERSFKPISYLFLLAALIRLVGYDMAQADTLERAIVFLVAGSVLIGMNQLYSRFLSRRSEGSRARLRSED